MEDDPEIERIKMQIVALGVEAKVVRIFDHWGFIVQLRRVRYCSQDTYETPLEAWRMAKHKATDLIF